MKNRQNFSAAGMYPAGAIKHLKHLEREAHLVVGRIDQQAGNDDRETQGKPAEELLSIRQMAKPFKKPTSVARYMCAHNFFRCKRIR